MTIGREPDYERIFIGELNVWQKKYKQNVAVKAKYFCYPVGSSRCGKEFAVQ